MVFVRASRIVPVDKTRLTAPLHDMSWNLKNRSVVAVLRVAGYAGVLALPAGRR